ncbi:hypothetical protein [Mycolicibacterium sphagni]|uniref:Uncharacterized protein n=1 Tax=Mycolicibacterium sphagni TaxID=1786 RepID=A0A255DJE6_9MYCO|nr:hypothetical protein [Mycolicibacterium sphagni]OYN77082.1 hypothetical protein CG716_19740 [Mycolicibacterium sphagni]
MVIFKIALVAFLVIGVMTIVVAYIRGLRRVKSQRRLPDPNLGPTSVRGVVAPTPLPEWAYWDENEEDPDRKG